MDFFAWLLQLKLLIVNILILLLLLSIAVPGQAIDYSDQYCGNLRIPYPFGLLGRNLSSTFLITCNESFSPPVAFLKSSTTIRVTDIILEDGHIEISTSAVRDCYNQSGIRQNSGSRRRSLRLSSDFTVANNRNIFTVIGCDSYAYIEGYRGSQRLLYRSGCLTFCSERRFVDNSSCSGSGCCQTRIPDGLYRANVTAYSFNNHRNVSDFNPCTYSFIVREDKFNFSFSDLQDIPLDREIPTLLEWKIDKELGNVCKDHAKKIDLLEDVSGYRCECDKGYSGNPYVGCQDINECSLEERNNCTYQRQCNNTDGSYNCSCPKGYDGDGRKDGDGCKRRNLPIIPISLGVGIGFISLVISSSWIYLILRKRKHIKLKEKFFKQNGGALLQEKLSDREGTSLAAKIFTADELKKATNDYDENSIIGKGGFGTVHRGVLSDGRVVAIKRSIIVDQSQIEQFINEVVVLSQINHRNIVRLLGCCLETQVPLLVYEFVTNGTLFDYIQNETTVSAALSWQNRLRIAAETAEALSYLHSAASIAIIHRDVKTTNVLLDATYTAKVSDFGASRLVPTDEMQLSTMVQGTWGYLDPEYMRTNQLTEKSDVYSFGVVLIELLTSMKALSFDRPEKERSLALYFMSSLNKGHLLDIIDSRIITQENQEQIEEVAKIALRCLALKGEERPSMKEIAIELQGLRKTEIHPWSEVNEEETAVLLNEAVYNFGHGNIGDSISYGFDSVKDHVNLSVGGGR